MLFYLVLFFAVSFFSFFYSRSKDIYIAKISKAFVFLLLFVPAALRYGIGTDYFSYVSNFELISKNNKIRFEHGFVMINRLSDFLNLGVQGVFAITAFLTLFFLFLSVPRKSFYIVIPVYFCMFYAYSYNAIRNALAIFIAYYAYHVFSGRKIIFSFVLIYIGSLFHISVLLFYPVFLAMLIIKINKIQTVVIFILSFLFFLYGTTVIYWIVNKFVSKTPYAYYIDTLFFQRNPLSFLFASVQLFVVSVILFFIPNDKNKTLSNIFIFLLVANILYILGAISDIFNRIYIVFSVVWLIILEYIYDKKFNYKTILLLFIFFWAFGSFIVSVGYFGSSGIIPYRMIYLFY